MSMTVLRKQQSDGFALLLALLVVSVVVTVGLTILEITIKQVRLASSAADSEISYSAANAGVECALYWRRKEASIFEAGNSISSNVQCFGVAPTVGSSSILVPTTNGTSDFYSFQFTWGDPATGLRCSRVGMLVIRSAATLEASITALEMEKHFPGYPGTASRTCSAGGKCTTLSVQGFNRACTVGAATFPPGTIQREVLVEL